jgi:uncharacterized protein (DUF362 family)
LIRVGLARTRPDYDGLEPPFGPGQSFPELPNPPADTSCAPNHVFAAVRAALRAAGLDADRFGSADWNPLGDLVAPGGHVVLKPNFIRHHNPCPQGTIDSVITHGAVVRAAADYAFRAVGAQGTVTLAEAPQMDCDFARIREIAGLDALERHYARSPGCSFTVIDLRREETRFSDGVIVERKPLPGDPLGYRVVDLGIHSFFEGSGIDPDRLRGADYDPCPTAEHHSEGRNAYLLSETVLSCDLVVNLPKLKTHKKTGVTLALKNLVGINGDKNWLPHHTAGSQTQGGDEFPGERWIDRARSAGADAARQLLVRGLGTRLVRLARRAEWSVRGDDFIRAGNWHGNQTTWRMCLDLNRCLYYSDAKGLHLDAPAPVRKVLTILDGVVAGEGAGPLSPSDRPTGVVVAGTDPLAVDLAAVHLMGFDELRLPKLSRALDARELRITEARSGADLAVYQCDAESPAPVSIPLDRLDPDVPFAAHPGWSGHVERKTL